MGAGCFAQERGWAACDTTFENAFFEFFQRRLSTHPTPGAPRIPLRWRPKPPAHPDGLHSTGSSAGRARCKADRPQQAAPACTRYQTGHTGQIGTAEGLECLRSVSDRSRPNGQNDCKQKYLFFMCKPLDKRNKIVYNIDSKQTYLHHHKTGGQNHEKDHRLYRTC